MPELPEVETTRKGISPYLENQAIRSITVWNNKLRWPVSPELEELRSVLVSGVFRRGKYIIIASDLGAILVHLGMSGSLRLSAPDKELKKHDHVVLALDSELELRFNDPRRFGCILWTPDWTQHPLIVHLGPEPLSDAFTGRYLYQKARSRKTGIKQFVMDAQNVVGVGNIYANEALFLSGISPKRQAGRVSLQRMELLAENIKYVLQRSIEQGGTTLRDFVNSDGNPGYFKQQLNVYGRAGLPCPGCKSALKEIRQNNRSSVYCSKCQI